MHRSFPAVLIIFFKNMNSVIFENESEIDPRAWSVLGMSAKTGDDPIGMYGTGLKNAISVLLREKQQIRIYSGGKSYNFSTKEEEFRGKKFEQIYCNDEKLPFTTEFGKNWKIWQAYREIFCNCLDESGVTRKWNGQEPFETGIVVTGREFYEIYKNRDKYFINHLAPLDKTNNVSVYGGRGKFYHRGNLAAENYNTVFCYSFKDRVTLTEERTIVPDFSLKYEIANHFAQSKNKELIKRILLATEGTIEHSLDWDYHFTSAGEEFLEVAKSLYADRPSDVSKNLRECILKYCPDLGVKHLEFSESQVKMLEKAKAVLSEMGYEIGGRAIYLVENQSNSLAFAYRGEIFLTAPCFSSVLRLSKALFEEWAHADLEFDDESREFQNYLIDQIFDKFVESKI